MSKRFGPTGRFPHGKADPTDEGEIRIGIAHDEQGRVIINFGTKVVWIGLYPAQAIDFAKTILKHCGASKIEIEFSRNMEAFDKAFEIKPTNAEGKE